jgi:hypothetical protein
MRVLRALSPLLAVAVLSCGESGSRAVRPIEAIFLVSGATGTQFRLGSDPARCGGQTGLRAANADHQFGDRIFEAPFTFVLENAFQPLAGTFEALDEPITVTLALGTTPVRAEVAVMPGQCVTVATRDAGLPDPDVRGPEVRFEVLAVEPPTTVSVSATLGDESATNLTDCIIDGVSFDGCRTPAIFFIEDPQETVSGVFSKYSSQNRDAVLRAELYVDGRLEDSETDDGDLVVSHDL